MHGSRGTSTGLVVAMVLLATSITGCLAEETSTVPERLVVSVDNRGSEPMPTQLTIEGPNGTLLDETFQAGPGNTTRTVPMRQDGTYSAKAHYHDDRGGQHVDNSQAHTVTREDCDTGTVTIHFIISYERSDTSQSFTSQGTYGECTA